MKGWLISIEKKKKKKEWLNKLQVQFHRQDKTDHYLY